MRKLKLSLDGMAVESFATTTRLVEEPRGTLHGHEASGAACLTKEYNCLTNEGCYSFSVSCALPVCHR